MVVDALLAFALLALDKQVRPHPVNCPEPVAGGVIRREATESAAGATAVKDDVQPPRLKSHVAADYPKELKKQRRLTATVLIQGTVDVDGNVGDESVLVCKVMKAGKAVEGEDKAAYCSAFGSAATAAFTRWRYEPALKEQKPVCVYVAVRFSFKQ